MHGKIKILSTVVIGVVGVFLPVILFTMVCLADMQVTFEDWKVKQIGITDLPQIYTNIPILIYHHFAPTWIGSNYYFTITTRVSDFERQIQYLANNGYTTLTVEELHRLVTSNQPIPKRSVVITIDDGYQSVYQYAYPILKKYNLQASFYVIYEQVGKGDTFFDPAHSTWEELQEMERSGVIDIQSHTFDLHYKNMDKKYTFMPAGFLGTPVLLIHTDPEEKRVAILEDSQKAIAISQEKLGKSPVSMAIPFGVYDDISLQALKESYDVILKTYIGATNDLFLDLSELDRVYVRGYHMMFNFRRILTQKDSSFLEMGNGKVGLKLILF